MNIQDRDKLALDIFAAMKSIAWPSHYQEPDYVAKLVTTLPAVISSSLNALLPGRAIAVGGAFVHQKPLAKFVAYPRMKKPELGDLLIVCKEQRAGKDVFNAILLQAKRVNSVLREKIPADHQFFLYSEWPTFTYERAGLLNGRRRSISPKTMTQGAQYLLIDKANPMNMLTAPVNIPLEGIAHIAWTISSVIAFDRGRTCKLKQPRDGWSKMIRDLLKISANAVFNRKKAGYNRFARISGDGAFQLFLNQELLRDIPVVEGNDFPGVSVICVDLGQAAARNNFQ